MTMSLTSEPPPVLLLVLATADGALADAGSDCKSSLLFVHPVPLDLHLLAHIGIVACSMTTLECSEQGLCHYVCSQRPQSTNLNRPGVLEEQLLGRVRHDTGAFLDAYWHKSCTHRQLLQREDCYWMLSILGQPNKVVITNTCDGANLLFMCVQLLTPTFEPFPPELSPVDRTIVRLPACCICRQYSEQYSAIAVTYHHLKRARPHMTLNSVNEDVDCAVSYHTPSTHTHQ